MRSSKYALLLIAALLLGCKGDDSSRELSPLDQQHITNFEQDLNQQYKAIAEGKIEIRKQSQEKNKVKDVFYWNVPVSHELQSYITSLCKQYNVQERMVYAVMEHESKFNPSLISSTNDFGLFQINSINQARLRSELGITNFLDPFQNSLAGIYMLSELQSKYGNTDMVLSAYNRGETGMLRLSSRGGFETAYSADVKRIMSSLTRKEGGN